VGLRAEVAKVLHRRTDSLPRRSRQLMQDVDNGVEAHSRGVQEVGLRAEVAKVLHRCTDSLPRRYRQLMQDVDNGVGAHSTGGGGWGGLSGSGPVN